ncbi:DUF7695 domain-containing protein [Paenimyroides ceti]
MKSFKDKINEINELSKSYNLKENERICTKCKDILTSENNYDLKKCSCGYLSIDGGNESYLRILISE